MIHPVATMLFPHPINGNRGTTMKSSPNRSSHLVAAVVFVALGGTAHAQLSAAQQSALKQSCPSDFMAHCAGVTPGTPQALACLQKNVGSLSPACKRAVAATMPAPSAPPPAKAEAAAKAKPKIEAVTPAAAPAAAAAPPPGPTPLQMSALKHTCGRDFARHCRGVPPGGPEALACLEFNEARLTPDCKTSLAAIAESVPAGAMPPAAPPPPVAPLPRPAAPVATGVVVGRACLRDLILHCRGTGVGEGEKIACLKAYAASGHRLGVLCAAALKITPMR